MSGQNGQQDKDFLGQNVKVEYLTIKKLCDLETTPSSDRTINSTHFSG